MTPKDWERLKLVFNQAMSLSPEERSEFVAKIRAEDEELGRNLADLIENDVTVALDPPLIDLKKAISPDLAEHGDSDETVTLSGFRPGHVIGERFRVVRRVGMGGMGEVFEAEDLQLGEHVALKMIRPDLASNPQVAARFKREILLGKRIAHPNVCRIHDLGSAKSEDGSNLLFLTMEFLSGETLATLIKRRPMTIAEALPLIEDLANGLTAAHTAGVIHRDFKSGNIMLVNSTDRIRAVITDFGLARALREDEEVTELTKQGAIGGTVGYMAPEQIRGGNVTPSADIYSLGVVMYEMVTGRVPFRGSSAFAVAMQHLNDAPPSPREFAPDLDAQWERAILHCLNKTPEERFSSAADVKTALVSPPVDSKPSIPVLSLTPARHKRIYLSLALVAMILLAAAFWAYRTWSPGLLAHQQRVAVLEFENVGGDPSNKVFSAGLMEALSSQLTELEQFQGSLSVVPASDVRRDNVTSAREAQRDFGVTLVITGSIQRVPTGMQLTINIVDARQLKQLRSHAMFIPQGDALSMQQGVVTELSDLLNIQLRPEAQRRLAQGNTIVPGAYEFYLQGSGYLLNGSNNADQSITEFQHALDLDANYALAHAGMGQAYWYKYQATKDSSWIDQAWRECTRAIELGPQLADAHITLTILNAGTGHYDEAISEARQAIRIDPRNDRAYSELARALDGAGKLGEAEATIKQAIALRPSYWYNYVRLGIFYGGHSRYKEAEAPFKQVIELVPDNPVGYTNLGSIYHYEGRESDAEEMLKRSIRVRPTTRAYSNLATVYFFERRYVDAVPIMEKLVAGGSKEYLQWGNLADAYRWAPGQQEKAPHAYETAIALANNAINVNPRDITVLSSLALYNAKLGRKADAVHAIKKALALAPNEKVILFKAAIVYELAGERAEALGCIRKAIIGGYSPSEIATEPELAKLRADPLYPAVVSDKTHLR